MSAAESRPMLEVTDLKVRFTTEDGELTAVDGASFEVRAGEVVAIVGESGCGKSVTAQTIMGLTRVENAEATGSIRFDGEELLKASDEELRRVRGNRISMIFQDPMTSFNPFYRIGKQIVEQIQAHRDVSDEEAMKTAVEMLKSVGIPDAERRARSYPHEFSGGMRQRAMIAMALSLDPEMLIADEPTTALDVTIQSQILKLLEELNKRYGLAVVLITHDLGVVAEIADRVLVMYAGRVVEEGTLEDIFYDPQHPYTWGLLGSLMRLDQPPPPKLPQIAGQPPSLINPPSGCHFRPRCPHAFDKCEAVPPLEGRTPDAPAHLDRCWLPVDQKRSLRGVDGRIGLSAKEDGDDA